MEITVPDTGSLVLAARQFVGEAMGRRRVVAFYGRMGAGKTTFIKAVCEVMGVEDTVTSPTFAIVNEYLTLPSLSGEAAATEGIPLAGTRRAVYHFDFYRVKDVHEAYDIGCEEYFYSGCPCFIEWPEVVEELLPEDTVRVRIEVLGNGSRLIRTLE